MVGQDKINGNKIHQSKKFLILATFKTRPATCYTADLTDRVSEQIHIPGVGPDCAHPFVASLVCCTDIPHFCVYQPADMAQMSCSR